MDRGGPESRVNDASRRPDWIFPQEGAPAEHVRPGWRPALPVGAVIMLMGGAMAMDGTRVLDDDLPAEAWVGQLLQRARRGSQGLRVVHEGEVAVVERGHGALRFQPQGLRHAVEVRRPVALQHALLQGASEQVVVDAHEDVRLGPAPLQDCPR